MCLWVILIGCRQIGVYIKEEERVKEVNVKIGSKCIKEFLRELKTLGDIYDHHTLYIHVKYLNNKNLKVSFIQALPWTPKSGVVSIIQGISMNTFIFCHCHLHAYLYLVL